MKAVIHSGTWTFVNSIVPLFMMHYSNERYPLFPHLTSHTSYISSHIISIRKAQPLLTGSYRAPFLANMQMKPRIFPPTSHHWTTQIWTISEKMSKHLHTWHITVARYRFTFQKHLEPINDNIVYPSSPDHCHFTAELKKPPNFKRRYTGTGPKILLQVQGKSDQLSRPY